MVKIISTENEVEKEILTTKKEISNKTIIQITNFLAQEPPTPVDCSLFDPKKDKDYGKKL